MPTPPFPRADLPTPALVLNRAVLDRNIAAMAGFAAARGLVLRPHAKTHKSIDIGKRQIAAGAVGLCCAKLGEAEALAAEGTADIHLTSPVVTPGAIARLIRLNADITLSVVVDHPDNARALGEAAAAAGKPLTVFVDVDPGGDRTGVTSPEAAVALAQFVGEYPYLPLGGVQFYCGPQQHVPGYIDRRTAIANKTDYLRTVLAALSAAGVAVPIVTGGGTGSFMIDAELGVLTELQTGSYVFLDREYDECELNGGGASVFEASLAVDSTVISANHEGRVTIDTGLKAFATEAGPARVIAGAPQGSRFVFMGDEHGGVILGEGPRPALGDRVTLMPPHCDPTVNLYDAYWLCEGDTVIDRWPVTARGRST